MADRDREGRPTITTRSVYDSIFSTVAAPQEVLYLNKPKNPVKSYIGRAAKIASSRNPSENLWCIKADIASACRRLTYEQRRVLSYKYVYDYSEDSIAEILGVSWQTVYAKISKALDALASVLDGESDA